MLFEGNCDFKVKIRIWCYVSSSGWEESSGIIMIKSINSSDKYGGT